MYYNILEIFFYNPIWQSIWFIALFFTIIAFLSKKDDIFLIFMIISSFFWWIHFFYLWLFSASFINFFDTFKNYLAFKYKKNLYLLLFLVFCYLIIWFFTFDKENLLSLLPIFNSILSVYFIFYLKWIKLKIWFLFILFVWFIYNYFWNSLSWMISDVILFLSWLYWIYNIKKNAI